MERDDRDAPCGFCWEMLFAYSPSCLTCRLRRFGSLPCLNDLPEYQECPSPANCPNGNVCLEIRRTEIPLANLAVKIVCEREV